ncbi:MAG: RNA polymerase sigma factor [Acidimicrobiales bacterium]
MDAHTRPLAEAAGDDAQADEQDFRRFVVAVEPRLRRALVAAYGPDLGRDAAADALAWAWLHWSRVRGMINPAGYLWRVGQTATRGATRRRRREVLGDGRPPAVLRPAAHGDGMPRVEPALDGALERLSSQQRVSVLLVHGHGFSLSEAAETLGCSTSTVRNHVERALKRLRTALEVDHE